MKYALIKEQRTEAQPNLSGYCLSCGHLMVAKCGEIKIWHWAHRGRRTCDSWWENETEWHRAWKQMFPTDWQEIVHPAENENHIADVKTDKGWVLEFQHSHLKSEERRARDNFYPKLAWVVNGNRRKRDKLKFFNALKEVVSVSSPSLVRRAFILLPNECALIRDWANSPGPVFLDFGDELALWCLLPKDSAERVYVVEFSRAGFIALHRGDSTQIDHFAELLKNLHQKVSEYVSRLQTRPRQLFLPPQYRQSRRPQGFQQHLARQDRFRKRF